MLCLHVPWTPVATFAINVSLIRHLLQHTLEPGAGRHILNNTVHADGKRNSRYLGEGSCWRVDRHITNSRLQSLHTGIRGVPVETGLICYSYHLMWMQAARYGLDWHKEVVVVYGCLVGLTKQEAQRQFLTLLNKKAFGEHPHSLPVSDRRNVSEAGVIDPLSLLKC